MLRFERDATNGRPNKRPRFPHAFALDLCKREACHGDCRSSPPGQVAVAGDVLPEGLHSLLPFQAAWLVLGGDVLEEDESTVRSQNAVNLGECTVEVWH